MDNKSVAKKYLISASALFLFGALFLALFLIAVSHSQAQELSDITISIPRAVLLAVCLSLVPTGSYTGFVVLGLRVTDISKNKAVLLIALFPLVLAFVTIFGIIMIIPSIIKCTALLLRS